MFSTHRRTCFRAWLFFINRPIKPRGPYLSCVSACSARSFLLPLSSYPETLRKGFGFLPQLSRRFHFFLPFSFRYVVHFVDPSIPLSIPLELSSPLPLMYFHVVVFPSIFVQVCCSFCRFIDPFLHSARAL